MSKDVDRDRVFQTTRVRTLLKNDGSWIHRSKGAKEEQKEASEKVAVETKPVLARQTSYVLCQAKKFESVETPQSPPPQKTELIPTEGDSTNQANREVIPPQKDAQPEGSTAETTNDTKPQASTEERVQNGEAPPEKSEAVSHVEPAEQEVTNTTSEKKEEPVSAPVESNIEQNEEAAKSCVDVCVEVIQNDEVQPDFVTKEKSEAVTVESAEQPVANTTAEKTEECVTPVDQSNVKRSEETAEASTAAHANVPQNGETQPVLNEKIEAVCPLEPVEQTVSNTVSENKEENVGAQMDQSEVEHNEEAVKSFVEEVIQNGETSVFLTKEEMEAECPVEPAGQPVAAEKKEECVQAEVDQSHVECSEEPAQSSADVHVEIIQNSETQSVLKENSEAESPVESVEQPVSDTTTEKKEEYVNTPVDVEYNKGVAEASAAASVEACVAKTSAEAGTEENKEAAEIPAVLTVELKPEVEPSSETEPTDVTNHEPAGVQSTACPAEGSCEKCPAEKYTEETVEAVAVVVEESLPETPAVTNAAAQEAASKDSREPVPDLLDDTVSESPTQPATETSVKSIESAAPAQPAPNTRAEEESKSEVQTAKDTTAQPAPETPAEHAAELRIKDAIEPATASVVEAVQDKSGVRVIDLTDALDVEAPTAEADPEPEEDPKQSHSEELKPNQKSDDANNSEKFEKPAEEQQPTQTMYKTRDGKAVCSFCDQTIDGNVKLSLSEPFLSCHPECLKCAVCTEALGDLLTPMFLHDQVIYCGECFAKAPKT